MPPRVICRTDVGIIHIFLMPGDHRLLVTKRHPFLISFGGTHLSDTNFFLQDEPALDEEHLFDDGYDRDVAFLADLGKGIDGPADQHGFDLDALKAAARERASA